MERDRLTTAEVRKLGALNRQGRAGTGHAEDPSALSPPSKENPVIISYTRWMMHESREYQKKLLKHAKKFLFLPDVIKAISAGDLIGIYPEEPDRAAIHFDVALDIVQLVEPVLYVRKGKTARVPQPSKRKFLTDLAKDKQPKILLVPDPGLQDLPSADSCAMHAFWMMRHFEGLSPHDVEKKKLRDAVVCAISRLLGEPKQRRGFESIAGAIDGVSLLLEKKFPSMTREARCKAAVQTCVFVGILEKSKENEEIVKAMEREKKSRQRKRKSGTKP